jgi:regulatory protein
LKTSLYNRAIRLLARRAHGKEELRRKLLRKATGEDVQQVLIRLEEQGYLDDEEFAYLRAGAMRRLKHWGNLRIRLDLRSRRVNDRIIERVLLRLEDELAEAESLHRAIQARIRTLGPPVSITQLKKLFDHCLRLGYSPQQTRAELDIYFHDLRAE